METDNKKEQTKFSLLLNKKLFKVIPVRIIFGAAIGLILGFLYYQFVGCSTNSCAITSNPMTTMFMGTLGGILVSSS